MAEEKLLRGSPGWVKKELHVPDNKMHLIGFVVVHRA